MPGKIGVDFTVRWMNFRSEPQLICGTISQAASRGTLHSLSRIPGISTDFRFLVSHPDQRA